MQQADQRGPPSRRGSSGLPPLPLASAFHSGADAPSPLAGAISETQLAGFRAAANSASGELGNYSSNLRGAGSGALPEQLPPHSDRQASGGVPEFRAAVAAEAAIATAALAAQVYRSAQLVICKVLCLLGGQIDSQAAAAAAAAVLAAHTCLLVHYTSCQLVEALEALLQRGFAAAQVKRDSAVAMAAYLQNSCWSAGLQMPPE